MLCSIKRTLPSNSLRSVVLAARALLVLAGASGCARAASAEPVYALTAPAVTIPFDYRNHQILVHAAIGGRDDLTFLVDTGAATCVLDRSLQDCGTRVGQSTVHEAEGETSASLLVLPKVALRGSNGFVYVSSLQAASIDLAQMSHVLGQRLDGILGMPFIAGFVAEIDYARRELTLRASGSVNLAIRRADNVRSFLINLEPASLTQEKCSMLAVGRLNDKIDYPFLLDTGFGGFLSISAAEAERSGLLTDATARVRSQSFTLTRRFVTNKLRAKALRLGSMDLSGRVVSVDSRNEGAEGQAGIIGNRLLEHYDIVLDSTKRLLWLDERTAPVEDDEAARPQLGMLVKPAGQRLEVLNIAPNSPAHYSGVRAGDMITEIDGHSIAVLAPDQAETLIRAPRGPVTLKLVRAADPNLGISPGETTVSVVPLCPLDWKSD